MKDAREYIQELVDLGLSQADIAKGSGLEQPTISRILNGKHKDTRSTSLLALAAFHAVAIKHGRGKLAAASSWKR